MDGDCGSGVPLRVLVVDDSLTYRTIVAGALRQIPGVEVVGVAANGKIALQKIERLHPEVLTLDVEMPEMDGLEVLRRLRSRRSEVGAIVLSAFTTEGANATLEALESGDFDFVVKPSSDTAQANAERLRQQLRSKIEAFGRSRQIRAIVRGEGPRGGDRRSRFCAPPGCRQATTRREHAGFGPTGSGRSTGRSLRLECR